jgi:uncharacterized protein (TIGR02246 family)
MNRRAISVALLCLTLPRVPSVDARTVNPPKACQPLNDTRVRVLFDNWNKALEDRTGKSVTALYAHDATLLPTLEVGPYTKRNDEILHYFEHFVLRNPVATIDEQHRFIKIHPGVAYDIGLYSFLVDGETTKQREVVKARYTFIYECEQGLWRISHHHSSKEP